MKLHRYFARKFLMNFLICLAILAAILALIDLMNQVGRFSGTGIRFLGLLQLVSLSTPETLYEFLPLAIMLSSISLFLGLARSSELVVTRALGWSAMRVLVAPLAMSLVIGAIAVTVVNPIVVGTSNLYDSVRRHYNGGGDAAFSIGANGLWLRQGTAEGQAVIHAVGANEDGSELKHVTFMTFAADGAPTERIEAATATLRSDHWEVRHAKIWSLSGRDNPEATSRAYDEIRIPTSLTQERIAAHVNASASVSFWNMPGHIDQLRGAGFSVRRPLIMLNTELGLPLFLATMTVIGAAFTMRHARAGRTSLMVLFALLSGFFLFFVRNFALVMGENGQIPIVIAAWAPPVAGLLMALGLILHLEDG